MTDHSFFGADGHGETQTADMAACHRVMTVLQRHYPDHPWMIGADHFAGAVHCRLLYDGVGVTNNGYGFLLHMATVLGPEGERKVLHAGGECLERFGLARDRATETSALKAIENGLDLSNIVTKSRS